MDDHTNGFANSEILEAHIPNNPSMNRYWHWNVRHLCYIATISGLNKIHRVENAWMVIQSKGSIFHNTCIYWVTDHHDTCMGDLSGVIRCKQKSWAMVIHCCIVWRHNQIESLAQAIYLWLTEVHSFWKPPLHINTRTHRLVLIWLTWSIWDWSSLRIIHTWVNCRAYESINRG